MADRRVQQRGPAVGALPAGASPDEVEVAVRRALRPLGRGAAVVVGASGGPDSAGLLALATRARPDLAVLAVHVRHGLRPDGPDVEAARLQAAVVDASFVVFEVEVAEDGHGVEAAARDARHAALQEAAATVGARAVLLGHTADDQAETVLLRLVRGAGAQGLGAMAVWRPTEAGVPLCRPLLAVRRPDVHAAGRGLGVPVADDPMNHDPRFARVAVRDVLPLLAVGGADPVGAMARAADLLRDDDRALADLAAEVVAHDVLLFADTLSVPDAVLADLAPAIARRVVRRMAGSCGVALSAQAVEEVLALDVGRLRDRDGLVASRGGGWLCLAASSGGVGEGVPTGPAARIRVDATPADGASVGFSLAVPGGDVGRCSIALPGTDVLPSHEVRTRRPGDRVVTAAGTRSVQDLLVDAGVPRLVRDRLPLLVAEDRVLWVPGVEADADLAAAGRRAPTRRATLTAA